MNHSWKHDGPAATSLGRACELCGALGRRLATPRGYTRWETQLAPPGGPWASGRVPACPAQRKSGYTPVSVLLVRRLKAEGIIPQDADAAAGHLPGDWRRRSTREAPAWQAAWYGPGGQERVFSRYPMRRCAEAPALRVADGEVIPFGDGVAR